MVMSPQNFSPIFFKNVAFLGKIVKWKNIQNLISNKKGYIYLPLPFKRDMGSKNYSVAIFSENTAFFEKTAKL